MRHKYEKIINELTTVIAVTLFIFEQSPANEAARAFIGFKVLDTTGNVLLVGVSVGLVTLLVELSSSFLIALCLHHSVKFKKFSRRFADSSSKSTTQNSMSDYALALGVGAGTLVVKKHFKNKEQTFRADRKSAFKASVAIAIFSAFVAFLASGGIVYAQRYGLDVPAQYFLSLVTDWRFWLVVVVVTQSIELLARKRRRAT